MRNKVILKNGMGYVKMHGFHGKQKMILDIGGGGGGCRPTNSILSRVLLILEH